MTDDEGWRSYYATLEGRAPRPLFAQASRRLPEDGAGRHALDVGCGDGTETLALLARGWTVTAVDASAASAAWLGERVPEEHRGRLTIVTAPAESLAPPACDLVYASLSLPFISPASFGSAWDRLVAALRPGGVLAVQLFGPHHTWATNPEMTFHVRADVATLLAGFEVELLEEHERDWPSSEGVIHAHQYEIIARRRGIDGA